MFHDHLLSEMVLENPDHSLVHELCMARCVMWSENQLDSLELCVSRAVVDNQGYSAMLAVTLHV